MKDFYYDLHIHSCLSPCADNDNTPNNIAGMASLCELDIVALTDHNSVLNCPAFFEAARKYGIIPIAGMELTTSEDIHMICLFESLSEALEFSRAVDKHRVKIKNRPEIFGDQLILDKDDNLISSDENLLPNATTLDLVSGARLVNEFKGICYPAHVDRQANGIISVLGAFPENPEFLFAEFNLGENVNLYKEKYGLEDKKILVSSDAHYLTDFKDKENKIALNTESSDEGEVIKELFKMFRGEI